MFRRFSVSISAFAMLGVSTIAHAQFNFSSFASSDIGTNSDQITLNGNAALSDTSVQLTTSGSGFTSGSAFYNTKQSVQSDFYSDFTYNLPGGDGIAFLLNNNSAGNQMLGDIGGFLGYIGKPNVLAVEFDNYDNGGGDVIGVSVRAGDTPGFGDGFGSVAQTVSGTHNVRIAYQSSTLSVYLDDFSSPLITIPNLSLTNYADTSGLSYIGFSAGEAAVQGDQAIQSWHFAPGAPPSVPAPGSLVTLLIGAVPGVLVLRRRKSCRPHLDLLCAH